MSKSKPQKGGKGGGSARKGFFSSWFGGSDSGSEAMEAARHLRFGWRAILLFVSLGFVLEMLLSFRAGWYLDIDNSTRRLMLRLGHAHGTLLSLVNIAYAVALPQLGLSTARRALSSRCLIGATILIPVGFILGGWVIYETEPGMGIILVPVGAVMLITGLCSIAFGVGRSPGK